MASMKPTLSRRSGFSMVELLLVAFILAIGLLGLTALQTMTIKGSSSNRTVNTAALISQGVLDQMEALGKARTYYLANAVNGVSMPTTFNALPYFANDTTSGTIGGFNIMGQQVSDSSLQALTSPGVDPGMTTSTFTVDWARRASTSGSEATLKGTVVREFVVNITWKEAIPGTKTLRSKYFSSSRYIQY